MLPILVMEGVARAFCGTLSARPDGARQPHEPGRARAPGRAHDPHPRRRLRRRRVGLRAPNPGAGSARPRGRARRRPGRRRSAGSLQHPAPREVHLPRRRHGRPPRHDRRRLHARRLRRRGRPRDDDADRRRRRLGRGRRHRRGGVPDRRVRRGGPLRRRRGGLYDWLDENGFAVPPGGEDVLQDYIDGGAHFLAAKVHLEAGITGAPERLSRSSSPTPPTAGRCRSHRDNQRRGGAGGRRLHAHPGTSRATSGSRTTRRGASRTSACCRSRTTRSAGFYGDAVRDARGDEGPSWVTEYSWVCTRSRCRPVPLRPVHGRAGRALRRGRARRPRVRRRRVRHVRVLRVLRVRDHHRRRRPAADADPDGVLPGRGAGGPRARPDRDAREEPSIRYVQHDRRLEFLFPVCGEGFVPDPGMCGDDLDEAAKGRGRATFPPALGLGLGALGLALLARRR